MDLLLYLIAEGLDILTALRAENNPKKNAQASSAFFVIELLIRDRDRIRTCDRLLRRQRIYGFMCS